jgi:hypothetical protein
VRVERIGEEAISRRHPRPTVTDYASKALDSANLESKGPRSQTER